MSRADDRIEFLHAKLDALVALFGVAMAEPLRRVIDQVSNHPTRLPRSAYRDIDAELDKIILGHAAARDAAKIQATLVARFGYSSFGPTSPEVLTTVTKRGDIRTEAEAKVVQDYLAGDFGGYASDESARMALGDMLRRYDQRRSSKQ